MSIRTFFGFLHKRGFIITNPFAYVVKPKQGKHATRIFNEVEIDKILVLERHSLIILMS